MLPTYPEATRRALARNILRNTLRVRRGESLLIETWSETLPWAASAVLEARILGARPMLVVEDEETYWKSVDEAPVANVAQVGSHDWAALTASDAYLYFYGPMDVLREEKLPPAVTGRVEATDHEWFRLVEKSGVRAARWDLGRTDERWARRFGVDLEKWRRELIEAATVDPRTLRKEGVRVAEAYRRGREVRITHPNGTDLTLRLAKRPPRVDDGVVDEDDVRSGNVFAVVPSGVTTIAVDETYAEGTFVANVMGVMFMRGVETPLGNGRWRFERGHLTEYAFASGGDDFRRAFETLGAGKDRPGILSVGLNPRISTIPLLFDQERGVVTVAIGRNSPLGGATETPRFTTFRSIRGATLEIDGKPVVDRGEIV